MNKLVCGIAALGLLAGIAFAQDTEYYLFEFKGATAEKEDSPWGIPIMGYAYDGASGDATINAADPVGGGNGILVFDEGVAKIINAGWDVPYNQYPGIFIGLKKEGGDRSPGDCENGFSYEYKSSAVHNFVAQFPMSECASPNDGYGNQWKKQNIAVAAAWTEITLTMADLGSNDAGGCKVTVSQDVNKIEQISWGFEGGAYSATPGDHGDVKSGLDLEIRNVKCLCASSGCPGSVVDPGDPNPIVSVRSVGLTVVSNGNALHIISEKGATVELFSLAGAKVFSSKIAAGNSILSLEKQRQGVYYAVITSGSQKQTVKVVLK
jgi:hypothetical protein